MEMAAIAASGAPVWASLAPCLDEAMSGLGREDQQALLLRYFEGHSLREAGQALGLSEDAAQKRISRALEKLRELLARRGVKVPVAVLTPALAANAVQAAPTGLAAVITRAALAKAAAPASLAALLDKLMSLTTAQTVALTALVGALPVLIVGHRLGTLRAEQAECSGRLAQARQALANLQSQETTLRRRLARTDDALRQLQAHANALAVPAPGELPAFIRVPKDLVAQSKLGWLARDWQLTPLLVQALGMRPEEVAAANQALSRFVMQVRVMQERRVTPSRERTLGADWWRTELQSREFRSFQLTACTNEMEVVWSNLLASWEQALGAPRARLLADSVDYWVGNRTVLLAGKAGLLTFIRPAKPSDPVIANDPSSTMLIEARALMTLPTSIRQVVESWWDLTDLNQR